MPDLLLELFSEEIPARMQAAASAHLENALMLALQGAGLACAGAESYSTPRRLAVWVRDIPAMQPDVMVERKGPKAGAPQAAIDGFLKSTGLRLEQLENRDGVYFAATQQKGRAAAEVLKECIEKILIEFPWPKSMRWGDGEARWVRPLHSILCIFDGAVVPVQFAGVQAGNVTYGHRFLAPGAITIAHAADYAKKLHEAKVMADREKRLAEILVQAEAAAAKAGLQLRRDAGLLEEVTGLVEWPVLLTGRIDDVYMDLPPEVLVSEMRGHQKYFALQHADGTLANQFVITANMDTADGGKAIIAGNERVLRARLADGRFFWDQDRKKTLEQWAEGLKTITYHAKLGSVADKVERVKALAVALADSMGAPRDAVARAAALCKADLPTGMVGEFPELQGVMGRYYALHQGENAAVFDAIRDHYKPLGPNDICPSAPVSACVALADKLDTLISMFAIGEKPTGSKDPFALRRAALGVIRIILENRLRLHLGALGVDAPLLDFFCDRLKVQLKDQGVRHDLVAAVFALGEDDLVRLVARVNALQAFLETPDGANLLAAYKRAANILAIEEKKDAARYDGQVAQGALQMAEEHALYAALSQVEQDALPLLEQEDFTGAMARFSTLRAPVDAFFAHVMVNAKEENLRKNRLALLARLRSALDKIANFALIES